MIDALDYLASIESDPGIGIFEPIDMDARTPVVLPRMDRKHLAKLFCRLGYRVGAEIGVERGLYSHCLWRYNPEATIYSIDPWQIHDSYAENYTQELMDKNYEEARERLAPTGCEIMPMSSVEAVGGFCDDSLDFVYIDGNHEFLYVTNDIAKWSEKVGPGGIVAGHDYARYKNHAPCHVKDVVNAWTYSHKIKPWFVLRGRGNSSWFWVKQ